MATAMQSTRVAILGVDVGGTFTDAVLLDGGRVRTAKVPTALRQEESVLAAARAVGAEGVVRFAHGTTVATNALLERRGARTAFVANEGFEHLLHLRRQTRAHLYRLCDEHPAAARPARALATACGDASGRTGELEPLDLSTLPDVGDAEAVAVCLLFSFRDPSHERAVVAELRAPPSRRARRRVARGRAGVPRVRARVDDGGRCVSRAGRLSLPACARGRARDAGLPEPLVMLSSGGVASIGEAAAHPATILVSGPAGGVVGAGLVARRAGFEHAIAFDMGGTSTDVCLLPGGRAARVAERAVGGFPIRLPTVDLHTVGAGGGSLVRRDAGGAIRVGPESAGAHPGPACYGAGGGATVTDANLLLGRLPAELPGGLVLDRDAAERALGDIDPAGRDRRRQRGDAARAARRLGRARPRSARLRARRVRRRRAAACLRACGGARHRGRARPAGRRRPLGARPRRGRRAARPRRLVRLPARARPASCPPKATPTFATAASRSS